MQKNKVNNNLKNHKNDSYNSDKHDSIFNYDAEIADEPKRNKLTQKRNIEKTKSKILKNKRMKRKQFEKEEKKRAIEEQKMIEKQNKIIVEQQRKYNDRIREAKKKQANVRRELTPEEIKRIKKRNKRFKTFSLIILVIGAVILFLLSPIFNIKKIEVENNSKVSAQEIISLSKLETGTNMFKITTSTLKSNIKENSYINTVSIAKSLPSTIKIRVTERTAEYMLELGSSYAYIDEQGYILEISKNLIDGKMKILGYETSVDSINPGNRLCKNDLDKLNVITIIKNAAKNVSIDNLITSINISDDSNYTLYLQSESKTIYLGDRNNLDTKMLYIQKILEKEKGNEGEIFVNVDLKNKYPYFKQKV